MDNDNKIKPITIAEAYNIERRERIATAVLAGWMGPDVPAYPPRAAAEAVEYADALIAELDKVTR